MSHTRKNLPQSQVELTITVLPADYKKHLEKAAERISMRVAVRGFRKGKVPYDAIKQQVGEANILQEALESIVQESFYQAVTAEKLDTVGMPQISVEKVAPGNELIYKATVALIPKITLADISKIKAKKTVKPVEDKQIEDVIENVRKLRASEVVKSGTAGEDDLVLVDMDMFLDKVPVDGGQAKNYRVYLSEDHYIPGFNKQLVGVKKDDEKTFPITFPKTHYQKHLAGKTVDVTVKVKDVLERQLAPLNDEFAKALGQESVEKLKELLRTNLGAEAEQKADQQAEIEILDQLIEKSKFEDIPEVLIDAERKKMFYELTRDLEKNNVSIEDYLRDIKKTQEELFSDFKDQAIKRAKAALLSREIAKENNIVAGEADIDAEIAMMKEVYKDNEEYTENLKKPEVRDTIRSVVQNRKVVAWLKEQILK